MMKRMTKRKKVKKVFSRRAGGGFALAPTDNFWAFKDYARTEVDKKEISKTIKSYIKKNYNKKQRHIMLACSECNFTFPYYIAASIEWKNLEKDFPNKWKPEKVMKSYFDEISRKGSITLLEKEEGSDLPKSKSPMQIVKERTSHFIADIEEIIDMWMDGTFVDIDNYSPYNELQKIDAPYNMAKGVYDYYKPFLEEAKELLKTKNKDLLEGYSHMTMKKKKEYHELLSTIVQQAEKYMLSKKAKRAVRLPKKQTADKQVKNIKYLKESSEYMLTSISPIQIPGKKRLYVFNTKNRKLTEFVSNSHSGFEVKGTTLKQVDLENSRTTTLRKPEDFLSIVMKKTPNMISKEWKKLTTKTSRAPNSRINKDMIMLRVLDK